MKLLMIIVESKYKEELEVLLNRNHVLGYTEIPQAHGVGTTGVRMGSRAFPDTSSIIFTASSTLSYMSKTLVSLVIAMRFCNPLPRPASTNLPPLF